MNIGRRSLRLFVLALGSAVAGCSSEQGVPTRPTHETIAGIPPGWGGFTTANFGVGIDRTARHSGRSGLYLSVTSAVPNAGAAVTQALRAEPYRGKRLRLSGWVTHVDATGPAIGVLMRVDSPGAITAFDDMHGRSVSGTTDVWHEISVVLDVANNAERILIGAAVEGQGVLFVDDMRLEVVGSDVPTTNMFAQPQATANDSTSLAAVAALLPDSPSNLDFEASVEPAKEAVDWIAQHSSKLTTTDPVAPMTDLAPLRAMIGSARLVGLGEGTHGTREFFRMKDRILRHLVSEMGFTRFAIEATSPEANDLNRYVLTGEGNPKILLSRLYFWTWNTQEVLDMIEWMRQWNSRASPSEKVQFLGFDMQYPGAAIDSVTSYVARVDGARSDFVAAQYLCLASYRNQSEVVPLAPAFYGARTSDSQKAQCARGLKDIADTLRAQRAAYVGRSSSDEFELRLHDARLVQQWEAMASVSGSSSAAVRARDQFMAENVQWIRDQAPPGTGVVLWAHNAHISANATVMGGFLRAKYGPDYVNLGFAFGRGTFNAVGASGGLRAWSTTRIPGNSIEGTLSATNEFSMLIDTRTFASGGSATTRLRDSSAMRSIGAVFDPNYETAYFSPTKFPGTFDLLIYIENTSASVLLPFIFR